MTIVKARTGIYNIKPHMIAAQAPASGEAQAGGVINISSNESVFGASPEAMRAARDAVASIERYPEQGPERLAAAIADRFGLDVDTVACGHGSDDLLARLARAYLPPGSELIRSVNGYQKVPNYAFANDAVPVAASDRDFSADVDAILACVSDRTRMVMLANPDNPTGTYTSFSDVQRLRDGLPEKALLVLDMAYAEYVDRPDYKDIIALATSSDNVVMTRTFSKIYGLAGMRLGWMAGPREIIDVAKRIGLTFPLSSPAIAAGIAALGDRAHERQVFETTLATRERFAARTRTMGLKVYDSQTNFLLIRFPDPGKTAIAAHQHLEANNILARRQAAAAFDDCIRFTIGLESEMETVARTLEEFLEADQ